MNNDEAPPLNCWRDLALIIDRQCFGLGFWRPVAKKHAGKESPQGQMHPALAGEAEVGLGIYEHVIQAVCKCGWQKRF